MPRGRLGQQVTFAIVYDEDQRYADYVWIQTRVGDTVRKICGRRGRPDLQIEVARLNRIASPRTVLRHKRKRNRRGKWIKHKHDRKKIRLPGTMRTSRRLHVYADFGGRAPHIEGGYAKLDTIDRPGRAGLSHFTGYDPVRMTIPVTFDAFESPSAKSGRPGNMEDDIDLLERMAGRGDFRGAAIGSPPLVMCSTRGADGRAVWLIPRNYQWSSGNDDAPLWRIAGLDWDESPLRNDNGNRMRQDCTVTVEQYVHVAKPARSAAKRNRGKGRKHGGRKRTGKRRTRAKH